MMGKNISKKVINNMKIIQRIAVPTGDICIVQGDLGKLEMLSIGDYGKDVNLKAGFMGLDREPSPVKHTSLLPLTEKWVVTISTQYGCNSGCTFCDVPKVGPGINATFNDLVNQVKIGLSLHPDIKHTDRLNIHYARMGEPTWNPSVLEATEYFKYELDSKYKIHPVVSSMMPHANKNLKHFIHGWMDMKNHLLDGEAGLQLSINSTDENARTKMFRGSQTSLEDISRIMNGIIPKGRKITLNFALGEWDIDGSVLRNLFDPEHYLCKLTPLHRTRSVNNKGLMPDGDWTEYSPYRETEENLKAVGYDVIVFIASKEEDESKITCGNALLSQKEYE